MIEISRIFSKKDLQVLSKISSKSKAKKKKTSVLGGGTTHYIR